MSKTAKREEKKEAESAHAQIAAIPVAGLTALLRHELRDFVVAAGMKALEELLEEERSVVCGRRYSHNAERRASRNGHAKGSLVMGGRRVTVRRPRARTRAKEEVILPSWSTFSSSDPLTDRAVEQMVVGVSTRKYRRSLERLPEDVVERGTSKSAVSRRFVAKTEEQMTAWMKRDLGALELAALMLDGICFREHVMLVAVGIDVHGNKHILGLREGATENAVACTDLLTGLRERGLKTDRSLLVVIDGGKALRAAVRKVFGVRALVQRCQVHKTRNVGEYLPKPAAASAKKVMQQAYRCGDPERAKRLLTGLARQLETNHPSAAESLREGLEETLTIMHLDLPEALARSLACTNIIENLMGSIRDMSRRVKKWRGGKMIERWTCTAILEASNKFRRLRGFAGMKKLVLALQEHDQKIAGGLALEEEAA
jgi:transposase-like protein